MIASIILVLYFSGIISLDSAIASLYISAVLLLVAEAGVISMGILSLNALLAAYAGYALQTGDTMFMDVEVGWGLLFGIVVAELLMIVAGVAIWQVVKKQRANAGVESMVGNKAAIVEWDGTSGKVNYEGEIWSAQSRQELELRPRDQVTIMGIKKLTLTIEA